MLELGFYLVNATTVLLWLLQNCDHVALVGFIALGAVFLLVSLCVIAGRIVSNLLYIPNSIIKFLFSVPFYMYDICSSEDSLHSSSSSETPSILLRSPRTLLDQFASDRQAVSLPPIDRRLSLPQSLALNPSQWSELELLPPRQRQAIVGPETEQSALTSSSSSHPPLRRSRRIRHVRVRDPYIYSS